MQWRERNLGHAQRHDRAYIDDGPRKVDRAESHPYHSPDHRSSLYHDSILQRPPTKVVVDKNTRDIHRRTIAAAEAAACRSPSTPRATAFGPL